MAPLSCPRFQSAYHRLTEKVQRERREMAKEEGLDPNSGSVMDHSMGQLLTDLNVILFVVCITSLILGTPLMANALWHLRVASNASGRGVLRLIQLQYCVNLISVSSILLEMVILAMPARSMPSFLCLYLEVTAGFVRWNIILGGFSIAISR